MVGNKVDLADRRVVTKRAGEEYATSINASFFETSALNNICKSCAVNAGVWLLPKSHSIALNGQAYAYTYMNHTYAQGRSQDRPKGVLISNLSIS